MDHRGDFEVLVMRTLGMKAALVRADTTRAHLLEALLHEPLASASEAVTKAAK